MPFWKNANRFGRRNRPETHDAIPYDKNRVQRHGSINGLDHFPTSVSDIFPLNSPRKVS
jgi:hypothetical protein